MVRDRLVYAPGLRSVILRWIWGRPGLDGGWRLQLPGATEDQALRPPRRGLAPEEVGAWMDQTLTAHGWQRAEPTSWPPATLPRFVTTMAVIPTPPQSKIE
ncbi:hypothetical protein ACSDR0_44845 [Streptosporangium sp. G11]|uniref:hypothetical protein n=1 Tax=Streptosporangium sp. G11 TaxID=3436926 RepID=UPI003EBCC356